MLDTRPFKHFVKVDGLSCALDIIGDGIPLLIDDQLVVRQTDQPITAPDSSSVVKAR